MATSLTPRRTNSAINNAAAAAAAATTSTSTSRNLSTGSRARGRLLWRGTLVLYDGSHLPGISLVSTSMPLSSPLAAGRSPTTRRTAGFSRLPSSRLLDDDPQTFDQDDDNDDDSVDKHIIQDPAVEADFCLALEMVRHRPLRVLAIEKDQGPGPNPEQTASVHWQHSRSMRMYIDPNASRTIDFFQRKFCLDGSLAPGNKHAKNIVLISLEPSQALTTPSSKPANSFAVPDATSVSSSAQELAIFAVPAQTSSTGLASLVKQGNQNESRPSLELVLGRKVVIKSRTRKSQGVPALGSSQSQPQSQSQWGFDKVPPRPDDPMPRSNVNQLRVRLGWPGSGGAQSNQSSQSVGRPLTKAQSAPSLDHHAHRAPYHRGGVTPGRRGEKRPQKVDVPLSPSGAKRARVDKKRADVISMPTFAEPELRAGPGAAEDLPPLDDEDSAYPAPTTTLVSPLGPKITHVTRPSRKASDIARADSLSAVEEGSHVGSESQVPNNDRSGDSNELGTANKNTVRKLVHHQLLGRGYDKQDEDYVACYSVACAAVLAALRHSLHQRLVNRRQAATVAERFLSLLLPGNLESNSS